MEKPLNCQKVTVWAALSSRGIIGPFFFEDTEGDTVTVNSERYLKLMKSKFLPALRRKVVNLDNVWFQQDVLRHTLHAVFFSGLTTRLVINTFRIMPQMFGHRTPPI